jgi:hypothetical protein
MLAYSVFNASAEAPMLLRISQSPYLNLELCHEKFMSLFEARARLRMSFVPDSQKWLPKLHVFIAHLQVI